MPLIIRAFAYIFTKLMRVSGAESLVVSSNIFVGIESALTVKPHLKDMTRSEFCTLLSVGMATVASSVLALYVFILKEHFPSIAAHLISASLLSAPAALVISKIIVPEEESPKTLGEHIEPFYEKDNSIFQAIIKGANSGTQMILGIIGLLIAVLGLVALFDSFLFFLGNKIHTIFGISLDLTLKAILGYFFYPFSLLIGIPLSDAKLGAQLIGERAVATEVVSYINLATLISQKAFKHSRSIVIITYALCGFAHFASMSIFVGGISALVPERIKTITEVAFKA